MVEIVEVIGYDQFDEQIKKYSAANKTIYTFLEGSYGDDGKSWCSVCNIATPIVLDSLKYITDPDSVLFKVQVGSLQELSDDKHPFRSHKNIILMKLPTLLKWGTERRLEGHECLNQELIQMLFSSDSDTDIGINAGGIPVLPVVPITLSHQGSSASKLSMGKAIDSGMEPIHTTEDDTQSL